MRGLRYNHSLDQLVPARTAGTLRSVEGRQPAKTSVLETWLLKRRPQSAMRRFGLPRYDLQAVTALQRSDSEKTQPTIQRRALRTYDQRVELRAASYHSATGLAF